MAEISKITLPNGSVYDLKANVATKFSSNRTIQLTGDVTGSASSNGESGWSIATTVKDNSHIHYVDTISQGSVGIPGTLDPLTQSMVGSASSNKSFGLPADAIVIEYSTDGGSTWLDYGATDAQKKSLFNETRNFNCFLGKALTKEANNVNNRLRITIEPIDRYTFFNGIYCWYSSQGNTTVMDLERSTKGSPNTFTTVFTGQSVQGWSGNNIRYFSAGQFGGGSTQTSNYYKYRITLRMTAINADYASSCISDIRFFGVNVWNGSSNAGVNNMLTKNRLYTWDGDLNATFPAQLTATQFNGNATSASKLNSTRSFTIGKTAKNVDWSGAVSFSQAEISDNASTSAAGWMSKDDKTKLNGIETGAQVNTITGVKGGSESTYRTGDVNITATNIGLGNVTNNKQVKGLSSGTTNNNLVAWGSDGYTVADSGIAKGSVATKLALSGTNYSASSNTITVTKANLQSAVQDSSLVLMTAAERTKLASIDTSGNYVTVGGAQTITGAKTFSALTSFTKQVTIGSSDSPSSATGKSAFAQGGGATASGDFSHAEGWYTTASGSESHAEGNTTQASGEGAHAQGQLTFAIGDYSHASGTGTFATGDYQTVIGKNNKRTVDNSGDEPVFDAGDYAFIIGNGEGLTRSNALTVDWTGSVATGNNVTASGESSIATGCETVASGFYSHAEGLYSVASNICSHASGEGTYATAANQTTIGKYNTVTIDSTFDPPLYDAGSDFALIIGNGTSNNNRSNALTVYWDGTTKSFGHFLSQQSGITIGTTPSSSQYLRAFGLMDSTGYPYADIQHTYIDDGYSGMTLCVNRDVNNTTIQNFFRILIGADGTRAVRFNDPEAWRKGLGVNIKTYSVTLTTNQYGEINLPATVSGKTILSVRTNAYNYGVFLTTRLRVYNVEGTNPVVAASKSIPLVFVYID